jgi:phage/plasmid-associated DNA primase
MNELLRTALSDEDIDLLQRWVGSVLLGGNPAQRFMILTGTAGGGKSTVISILELIVGLLNITQLKTDQLGEKFEQSRFLGKQLLCGKDVPGDFLEQRSTGHLKALIGGDYPGRGPPDAIIELQVSFFHREPNINSRPGPGF